MHPVCAAPDYAAPVTRLRPSGISEWPQPFDPAVELDWGRGDYGRRLLREHLDQSHDGATRRASAVRRQLRRLRELLPEPPAAVLDAGCGPGLYAVPLAEAGHAVTGLDANPAAIRHARSLARRSPAGQRLRFIRTDLRLPLPGGPYDAGILIYYVLEAFPRREQPALLRRLAEVLAPGGVLIAELRLRPDQVEGRIPWWEVVPRSVLADRRHLLLGDTTYDRRRNLYVLREIAVFDDGSVATQQTSAWLCPFDAIPRLFERGGFRLRSIYDGWTTSPGSQLSESVLVVAERRG
jgi:SAM-dependent methyltransferase